MSKMQVDSHGDIDESLYSRQLYVLGREAMQRMSQSNVLIVGMRGLGVEIAKNVVLAGVKSVAIHDPHPVEIQDLSSQFFLHEKDIGKSRAEVTASRLAELNTYVPVSVVAGELDEETLAKYQVVVLTDTVDIETQVRINEFTHKNGIKFISSELRGLFGKVFVDFGDEFTVFDPTGEEPLQGIVNEIEPDGTVMAVDEQRHGLEDGDWVQFSEVEGLEALNDGKPREIKVTGPFSFNIGDVSSLGVYKKGGQFLQVKRPKTLHFKTLAEQLAEPDFLISDFAKFDRPTQLHIGFLALQAFSNKHGHLPRPRNVEDSNEVLHLAKNVQAQYPLVVEAELDEKLIRELAFQARGDLVPLAAVYGGLIAQEVLKACSGKFVPIHQWMYFDSLESLPKDHDSVTEEDAAPRDSRYDGFYAVFGKKYHEKLANLKIFLVGSGAIGCEMLKNWAMLGIGSGPEGKIIVTDNDSIEKSNLNRQFLFRPKDVGKEKSEVAAAAVAEMNPDLSGKIEHRSDKVGEDTENIFNDSFWNGLDFVTNALDNVEARTYIDRRCVFFQKPLLESGTLGTKGNVQVVIPFLTESYSSSQDPPEKSIPLCTLRSFPNKIDHTIAWSKSLFQGYFAEAAENVNLYLTQPNYMESTLKQSGDQKGILETIYNSLVAQKPLTFEECIAWARVEFEKKFTNDIEQLLYNFPPDAVTSTGTPFWGGPKRVPTPLKFDIKNENHLNFIVSGANLHAFNYGLKGGADLDTYERVLANVEVPKFTPLKDVKIAADDAELANQDPIAADQAEISALLSKLPTPSSLAGFRLKPVEFEKDDDTNYHIDFITAGSNLRALNYGIETADRSRTKFIAGRIIPAIATTTALVTGLVCLELFKVVDRENKTIEDYKNGFINLALPFFGFSEPLPSPKNKQGDFEFDETWGRFTIQGDVTIAKFIEIMKEEHKLSVTMISSGSTLLYAQFFASAKLKDRLPMTFTQALESISKEPLPSGVKHLVVEICAEDDKGEDVDPLPYVALFF